MRAFGSWILQIPNNRSSSPSFLADAARYRAKPNLLLMSVISAGMERCGGQRVRDDRTLPIQGVLLRPLLMHADDRGCFTEVFRRHWHCSVDPVQWNVVHSRAKVLRGVHLHPTHADYLITLHGQALVGLADLREDSPTRGAACIVTLEGHNLTAIEIPPGVAHGFYFPCESMHLYAVSHYWDPADELGCRWNDPALGIPWPAIDPIISPRDQALGTVADLRQEFARTSSARGQSGCSTRLSA